MKRTRKIIGMILCILVMCSLFAITFADDGKSKDPLDRLNEAFNSKETQNMAWGIVTPFAKIAGVGIIVLAIIGMLYAILELILNAIKAHRGKGKVGKELLIRVGITFFIALLLFGGGWVTYIRAGKNIIVDPTTQVFNPDIVNSQTTETTEKTETKTPPTTTEKTK